MKSNLISIISIALLMNTGCDAMKKMGAKKEAEPAPVVAPLEAPKPAPTAAAVDCKDGEAPRTFSGSCEGTWKFVKNGETSVCNFDWGPRVSCEDNEVSLGHEAECYGLTSKPVANSDKIKNAAGCAEKFGKRPMEANYTMKCCPK